MIGGVFFRLVFPFFCGGGGGLMCPPQSVFTFGKFYFIFGALYTSIVNYLARLEYPYDKPEIHSLHILSSL